MYIFDEHNEYFRYPGGALETPGGLRLRLQVERGKAANVRVHIKPDNLATPFPANPAPHRAQPSKSPAVGVTELTYAGVVGAYDIFEIEVFFATPGLYWFHFTIHTVHGEELRVPAHQGGSFQITAYAQNAKTPDWIKGGIIYHVFVDRFFRGGELNLKPGAVFREDWGGTPYYTPDEKGIVRNNDFFGGDLYGVIEKLPYLKKLGVTCIYLSPIFEAASNHKYDTGDFMKIDSSFGGCKALEKLCKEAAKSDMKVILDGVFNHVGTDSRYFNRYGSYDEVGAYQSKDSPYRDWFTFNKDGSYEAWWGIELLPAINEQNPHYQDFICGSEGVIAHWTKKGVSGWRLDVVDELPDAFLDPLCRAMRREKSDAVIVGEVWEDASNKIAYDVRRRYFLGGQLDSVTNYPLRDAIIACVKENDIQQLADTMARISANYPKEVQDALMNTLGSHDTMRILTALGGTYFPPTKEAMEHYRLDNQQLKTAKQRLKMAAALQFTLPGVPCVYYADEAGMEGGADPLCRKCYPWGHEDTELIEWYTLLAKIRRENKCFIDGKYELIQAREGVFAFTRGEGKNRVLVAINISDTDKTLQLQDFNHNALTNRSAARLTAKRSQASMFLIK